MIACCSSWTLSLIVTGERALAYEHMPSSAEVSDIRSKIQDACGSCSRFYAPGTGCAHSMYMTGPRRRPSLGQLHVGTVP